MSTSKARERELEPPEDAYKEWKVLDEWLVDLTDLVPCLTTCVTGFFF
jgi:hypothetical protein